MAVANDPSAIYWNPAGLASMQRQERRCISHIEWPARHQLRPPRLRAAGRGASAARSRSSSACCRPRSTRPPSSSRSAPAARSSISDVVAGVAYARRWTDKLLVGVGRQVRARGPGLRRRRPGRQRRRWSTWARSTTWATAASASPPRSPTSARQLKPERRSFVSPGHRRGARLRRLRSADRVPLRHRLRADREPRNSALTTSLEVDQPADNAQLIKAGLEWTWQRRLALRGGYNFNADEMKLSAGAGVFFALGQTQGDGRLRVHRRRPPRRRQPAVARDAVLMRDAAQASTSLSRAARRSIARGGARDSRSQRSALGCGGKFELPTERRDDAQRRRSGHLSDDHDAPGTPGIWDILLTPSGELFLLRKTLGHHGPVYEFPPGLNGVRSRPRSTAFRIRGRHRVRREPPVHPRPGRHRRGAYHSTSIYDSRLRPAVRVSVGRSPTSTCTGTCANTSSPAPRSHVHGHDVPVGERRRRRRAGRVYVSGIVSYCIVDPSTRGSRRSTRSSGFAATSGA